MFARILSAIESILCGTSFAKYLSLVLCGLAVALLPHLAAQSFPTLTRFTVAALALPGFVMLYAGLGGIAAHLAFHARR